MGGWGCDVLIARDACEAIRHTGGGRRPPDIILADYHLDAGINGIDVMEEIIGLCGIKVPGIVITADHTEAVCRESHSRGYRFHSQYQRGCTVWPLVYR